MPVYDECEGGAAGKIVTKKKKEIIPLPVLAGGNTLIDSHCHLDMAEYHGDLEQVLERAFAAGVGAVITVGINLESSAKAVELAQAHENVYATVGVHPHNVSELSEPDYAVLENLARQPKVVAYGEIGLDTVKLHSPVALQISHFERQIRLACDLGLPLIIHDRGAHDLVMDILRSAGPFAAGGVMHCFSGDVRLAEEVLALGFFVSIPGIVTFPKAETLHDVVRHTPLDRLLLETDGPFLAPVPYRGKRNEPLFTLFTAAKVAELKGVSLEEVAMWTTRNGRRIFKIDEIVTKTTPSA